MECESYTFELVKEPSTGYFKSDQICFHLTYGITEVFEFNIGFTIDYLVTLFFLRYADITMNKLRNEYIDIVRENKWKIV